jgi:hypothetical protein
MAASEGGHTETLSLLLANKADVHATLAVIIMIPPFEFGFTLEIEWIYLCDEGFREWSHRDTRAAFGQQI